MNREDVLGICQSHNLAPNKKLGQNFLINNSIIDKIIDAVSPGKDESILEIGPGLGAVSQKLSQAGCTLTLVEIDSGLASYLNDIFKGTDVSIIHEDFLKIKKPVKADKVVSNLPYYCASEILFVLAQKYNADDVFVMMQKEMAERIVAKPATSSYGALTVTLGLYYDVTYLFNVPSSSFFPRPDVQSSFIRLKKHGRYTMSQSENRLFHDIVKSAFWGRRKQINKALKASPHLSFSSDSVSRSLEKASIDKSRRGETLSLEEFLTLTQQLGKNNV